MTKPRPLDARLLPMGDWRKVIWGVTTRHSRGAADSIRLNSPVEAPSSALSGAMNALLLSVWARAWPE